MPMSQLSLSYPRASCTHLLSAFLGVALFALLSPQGSVTSEAGQTPQGPLARVVVAVQGVNPSGLAASALTILDNNKPVTAIQLSPAKATPVTFSLLFDASASLKKEDASQTSAATSVFRALAVGKNHGFLVLFRDEVGTEDHFVDAQFAEQILKQVQRRGSTALYDAIVYAVTRQLTSNKAPSGSRRELIVFSDGGDNISRNSLAHTISVVQNAGIPLLAICPSARQADKGALTNLRRLAEATGGTVLFLDEGGDVSERLLGFLDAQYFLEFAPNPEKRGKLHSLLIRTNSPQVEITFPSSYLAP